MRYSLQVPWFNFAALLLVASALQTSTDEDALPSQPALERALHDSVRGSCPSLKYQIDPALAKAAQGFASAVEAGKAPPSGAALGFYASIESAEPAPVAGVATIEPASQADRAVGDLYSRACRFNRAGVAAGRYKGGAIVALLTARHELELSDLPGQVAPGAEVTLSGKLPAGLKSPRLFVLQPGGTVDQRDLGKVLPNGPALPENKFHTRLFLETKGEHVVEVLADGAGGPQVVAMRRVFVGVPPPAYPPPEVKHSFDETSTGTQAAAAAISELRAARGLPPLVRDAALDAVAKKHSQAMAHSKTFAHVLKSDGTLSDRLQRDGYAYRFAGENIGLADTAALAHEAVALSPAHLANLLDPRHKRFGLGAVEGTSPEGATGVYLTEVLAAPVVGLADPAGEVMKLIARHRQEHAKRPLLRDRRLDQVAEREARAAAMSGGPPFVGDAARRALDTVSTISSAAADLYVGSQPEDVLRSKNLENADWTHVGIGALYASSDAYGPGRLWVLVVFAK